VRAPGYADTQIPTQMKPPNPGEFNARPGRRTKLCLHFPFGGAGRLVFVEIPPPYSYPTFSARWRAVGNCVACLFIMKMQLSFDSAFVPFPLFAGALGSLLSARKCVSCEVRVCAYVCLCATRRITRN